MIIRENYGEEHIRELQAKSRRDPQLIERALYALGLLEALTQTGMKFIFKGGSCLMLLLPRLMRLSTDIDIIVAPGTDVKEYIKKAAEIFPFVSYEEQVRVGKNNIEKRHFKFTYFSPVRQKDFYILLDILYEENHYTALEEKEIPTARPPLRNSSQLCCHRNIMCSTLRVISIMTWECPRRCSVSRKSTR